MVKTVWLLLAWASITVTHAEALVFYLPSNYARAQPTQNIAGVSNFAAICSTNGGLPGLDLARGYVGSDSCPGNTVSQMLPNAADYNLVLLINDTRPLSSRLLSQFGQRNALQTIGNRQVVKPTAVRLPPPPRREDILTTLVVGEMAYRQHADPNRWFAMLEESTRNSPNVASVSGGASGGPAASSCRTPTWPSEAYQVEVEVPHTLSRLEELLADVIGRYVERGELGLRRHIELTKDNNSLRLWWPQLEGLTGQGVSFDIEYRWTEYADPDGTCARVEDVVFTPGLRIDPDRAQVDANWVEFTGLYRIELESIVRSCDRSGNTFNRCIGEIGGFRDAVFHSISSNDPGRFVSIRDEVQVQVSRFALAPEIMVGFDNGANWWTANVPFATRDRIRRQLDNPFTLSYYLASGRTIPATRSDGTNPGITLSLYHHLINALDGGAGGKIFALLNCDSNSSADDWIPDV